MILDFASSAYQRKDYQIRGGRVWLEPARKWAVHKFDLNLYVSGDANATGRIEYEREIKGCPVPKTYEYDFKAIVPNQGLFHKHRSSVYNLGTEDVPAGEFRLPAYGLPEPFPPRRKGFLPVWALPVFLAVVCLSLSIFLKKRSTPPRLSSAGTIQ